MPSAPRAFIGRARSVAAIDMAALDAEKAPTNGTLKDVITWIIFSTRADSSCTLLLLHPSNYLCALDPIHLTRYHHVTVEESTRNFLLHLRVYTDPETLVDLVFELYVARSLAQPVHVSPLHRSIDSTLCA